MTQRMSWRGGEGEERGGGGEGRGGEGRGRRGEGRRGEGEERGGEERGGGGEGRGGEGRGRMFATQMSLRAFNRGRQAMMEQGKSGPKQFWALFI